jgi:hypothetical protein
VLTIAGFIINMIEGLIRPWNEHCCLHFDGNICMRSRSYEEKWLQPQFGFANHLALVEISNPMRSGL